MEMLEMHCIFFLEGLQGTAGSARPPWPSPPWSYDTRWHRAPAQQGGVMLGHPGVYGDCAERHCSPLPRLCGGSDHPPPTTHPGSQQPPPKDDTTHPPIPGCITRLLGLMSPIPGPTTHPGSYHPPYPHNAPVQVPHPEGTALQWVPDKNRRSQPPQVTPSRTHSFSSV